MEKLLKENHIKIDKVRALSSQFSYTDVMMNMKILALVTPPSIYHFVSPGVSYYHTNGILYAIHIFPLLKHFL